MAEAASSRNSMIAFRIEKGHGGRHQKVGCIFYWQNLKGSWSVSCSYELNLASKLLVCQQDQNFSKVSDKISTCHRHAITFFS
jgi:hypothetical protein